MKCQSSIYLGFCGKKFPFSFQNLQLFLWVSSRLLSKVSHNWIPKGSSVSWIETMWSTSHPSLEIQIARKPFERHTRTCRARETNEPNENDCNLIPLAIRREVSSKEVLSPAAVVTDFLCTGSSRRPRREHGPSKRGPKVVPWLRNAFTTVCVLWDSPEGTGLPATDTVGGFYGCSLPPVLMATRTGTRGGSWLPLARRSSLVFHSAIILFQRACTARSRILGNELRELW